MADAEEDVDPSMGKIKTKVFYPRKLTDKEQAELDEADAKLHQLKAKLEAWSKKVEEAAIGSPEHEYALQRETFYVSERDKARLALQELKIEFGQVDPTRKNEKA